MAEVEIGMREYLMGKGIRVIIERVIKFKDGRFKGGRYLEIIAFPFTIHVCQQKDAKNHGN